ncbi:uncharacterized protein LOC114075058 [Solanum pennellii]|uniref:Uncharacterized protein LOC114075058 n=1 Tax=Solanum pennellii TaxID=28526 RepID=A0ABM1V011_SOLPN|nr:uncharacterized protein LOC114075058 [Solanum pennellii]
MSITNSYFFDKVYKVRVMKKSESNKLCMDENDSMCNAEMRCKHVILLQMQTFWSDSNPERRFWSCPHYEATNFNFFRWRDKERVDERSQFILPKLLNRINELEKNYEPLKMQLEQLDNSNIEQSKLEKIPFNEGECLQNRYENLNINSKEKGDNIKEIGELKDMKKMKGMKMKKINKGGCFGKFICSVMICFVIKCKVCLRDFGYRLGGN